MPEHPLAPVPSQENFHIFTTFRLDTTLSQHPTHADACGDRQSNVYLLAYHYDRLRNAAATMTDFKVAPCLDSLDAFKQRIQDELRDSAGDTQEAHSGPEISAETSMTRRGKVSAWPDGRLEVMLVPVPQSYPLLIPRSLDEYSDPSWTVVLDTQATAASLFTEIKTSHRTDYDRARLGAGLSPASNTEVLLYNHLGEIMDGSITTVYFYRDSKWVTPQVGGLEGVTRRFALDRGLCSIAQSAVTADTLKDGETVWLSNAFRGFFPAIFRPR